MLPEVKMYGLLYFDPENDRHVNMSSRQKTIDIYLLCAANCSRLLRDLGVSFTLITNNRTLLTERLLSLSISSLQVLEYRFTLSVPAGVPFYSAHFKLELCNAFASGNFGKYVALIDIDTLPLRSLPVSDHLSAYEISDQIFPRYGRDVVVRDLEILAGKGLPDGRWYGGEFVMGSADQFRVLAEFINECWPRYVANIGAVHHLGDEMVLSAALNLYSEKYRVADYGAPGHVARWWSSRTFNKQATFKDVRNAALLHLPADKPFLATLVRNGENKYPILDAYEKHVRSKLLLRSLIPAYGLLGRLAKRFMPRLS